MSYSAAAFAAIAALFHPLPASAAPNVPPAPVAPAVPDAGSRPIPLGTLLMPGQSTGAPSTTPTTTPGVVMTPLLQRIEKQRTAIATLGDQLIRLGEDRELARQQAATSLQKVSDAQAALAKAEQDAAAAAAASVLDQAALPPGALGSGLADLDRLSQMQRGESATEEAADRQLALVQAALTAALAEQGTADTDATDLQRQWDKLNGDITKKQAALQKDEQKHADELSAQEAAQSAEDRRLGENYLDGTDQGRGADPRAIEALKIALAQIGDPYVWSEEGPDRFDCSGLMFYAYRNQKAGSFPLRRVSRDQYSQTSSNAVDRYSLVPGDLLFFSSSNSWTGIHHVAMYAGDGMMVEAPRTGLNVRLTPVRWSRLFQATRIWGSVDHPTNAPDLDNLPPRETNPKPSASATPSPSKTTKPPTTPASPSNPPSSSSSPPSNPPSSSSSPPSNPPSSSNSPEPEESESSTPAGGNGSESETPSGDTSVSPSRSESANASESATAAESKSASASAGSDPE